MKKILYLIFSIYLLSIPVSSKAIVSNSELTPIKIEVFETKDCKQCLRAKEWLEKQKDHNSRFIVEYFQIADNQDLYNQVKSSLKIKSNTAPLIIIGSTYFYGFNDSRASQITKVLDSYSKAEQICNLVATIEDETDLNDCLTQNQALVKQPSMFNIFFLIIPLIIILIIGITIFLIIYKKKHSQIE